MWASNVITSVLIRERQKEITHAWACVGTPTHARACTHTHIHTFTHSLHSATSSLPGTRGSPLRACCSTGHLDATNKLLGYHPNLVSQDGLALQMTCDSVTTTTQKGTGVDILISQFYMSYLKGVPY